jgi:HK97 gp10 family phage protein
MMAAFSCRIEGLHALDARLKAMGNAEAKKCIRKALQSGALIMQESIRSRAPVRPDLPSTTALPVGALASDIEIHNLVLDDNLCVSIGPGSHTAAAADWTEFGHQRKGGQVPAHPFLRVSYEATREESVAAIVTTLAAEIEKTAPGKAA